MNAVGEDNYAFSSIDIPHFRRCRGESAVKVGLVAKRGGHPHLHVQRFGAAGSPVQDDAGTAPKSEDPDAILWAERREKAVERFQKEWPRFTCASRAVEQSEDVIGRFNRREVLDLALLPVFENHEVFLSQTC